MPVTIAIPFYNAEKFLPDAIRSVFAQTYTDWELLLIDDGSTDRSLEIAKSVKDKRVRVFSDGKNLKLARRLNQVTQLATYDYIARMDADDLMSPTRIEKQVFVLESNSEIDLVTTGLFSTTDDLRPIGVRWNDRETISHEKLLQRNIVVHAAILARKSWYQRNHYDTTLMVAQDYELWLRSSYNNDFRLRFISEPLYYYREVGNVSLRKMFMAGKYGRNMFRKYGRSQKNQLIVKSYMKNLIAMIIVLFGQQKLLLEHRGKPLSDKKLLTQFESEINQIKSNKVPGLD
jgi:glycosyltransferase involved in cell wall biosynthesis